MPLGTMAEAMHEWGGGKLHSGRGGRVVPRTPRGQTQAQAIFYSMKRRARARRGRSRR